MSQPKLNLIFKGIKEKKAKIKTIKAMYKDGLANDKAYQELLENIKILKEKKKKIENIAKEEMGNGFDTIDDLNFQIENDKKQMTDIALKKLVEKDDPNFEDEHKNEMEAVFTVKYKKA